MDFADRLAAIASRVPAQTEHIQTEAATSTTLVMPFIQALGYDVFNPTEVVPEFTADVGTKKGEKVDYAFSTVRRTRRRSRSSPSGISTGTPTACET